MLYIAFGTAEILPNIVTYHIEPEKYGCEKIVGDETYQREKYIVFYIQ